MSIRAIEPQVFVYQDIESRKLVKNKTKIKNCVVCGKVILPGVNQRGYNFKLYDTEKCKKKANILKLLREYPFKNFDIGDLNIKTALKNW